MHSISIPECFDFFQIILRESYKKQEKRNTEMNYQLD
jgi:hypothetical protein